MDTHIPYENVAVSDIRVATRARGIQAEKLEALKHSIQEIGLQIPIDVYWSEEGTTDVPWLVVGAHRLEACRQLGWETIPCRSCEHLGEFERQLWELDENLARVELDPLEMAEHLELRKQLFDAKGGKKIATPGGVQQVGFYADTAALMGVSKESIRKRHARASIAPELREKLKGSRFDKGVELDELVKLPTHMRVEAVNKALASDGNMSLRDACRAGVQSKHDAANKRVMSMPPKSQDDRAFDSMSREAIKIVQAFADDDVVARFLVKLAENADALSKDERNTKAKLVRAINACLERLAKLTNEVDPAGSYDRHQLLDPAAPFGNG